MSTYMIIFNITLPNSDEIIKKFLFDLVDVKLTRYIDKTSPICQVQENIWLINHRYNIEKLYNIISKKFFIDTSFILEEITTDNANKIKWFKCQNSVMEWLKFRNLIQSYHISEEVQSVLLQTLDNPLYK